MPSVTLPLTPDQYTGRKLGKYEVLCQLSSGGMSQIFLAFQRGVAGFRKLVVLKQILPDIKAEEDVVQMFLDEAKLTGAFTHPHIAHVYDLDISEGELFLAMEFVPGATLIDVARACRDAREPIPIGVALMAVRDTALALHYAHTFRDPLGRLRQVIHRDVAEKNIMVTYEGVTKLLDFGIAKAHGRQSRTAVGKVKGTAGYMSPEQIRGDDLDPRSDVFSLGVVLHECLTGLRLYYDKDPEAGMLAVFKGRPPPPSDGNPEVTPALDAVALKSLAQERTERFVSALQFARALERAGGALLWHPETSAEFMTRHFEARRRQTAALLESLHFGDSEPNFTLAETISRTTPSMGKGKLEPLVPQPSNLSRLRVSGERPREVVATAATDPSMLAADRTTGSHGPFADSATVVATPGDPSALESDSSDTNELARPKLRLRSAALALLGAVVALLVIGGTAAALMYGHH